jgi:class 3 adenylate cyclase/predicted ATPase
METSPVRTGLLVPAALEAVVQEAQAVCAEVIRRFAGHIAQDLGDGLMVYFGYPQAHEDDAYRAVRTGLEMVMEVQRLDRSVRQERGVRLAVRLGIHTGGIVVDATGKGAGRESLALGETPHIAAQLHSLAGPDTVVISQATWQLVEGYVVCRPLGVFVLEKISQSLAVYQVLQDTAAQSRFAVALSRGLTPLVGREQQVGLLVERWAQVQEGRGQVVLLSGEAGIGKSRLIHVLNERLANTPHTQVQGLGSPYNQHSAWQPIIDYLRRLLQVRREDAPQETLHKLEQALEPHGFVLAEVVPLFAALLSVPLAGRYAPLLLTPQRHKQKTLEAIVTWLLKEAERQPLHVVMEDLHWMDASTLELLGLLIDHVASARMLLLLTCRPDFRPPWTMRSYLTYLTPSRLSRHQVEMMIANVAGGKDLPAEVVQQLVAKTEGVPLFVEELTKMVLESGLVKEREGRYELAGPLPALAIPTTLQDALMARLDHLGAAKQVAQLGAVLGREFAYAMLQTVAPMDEAMLQRTLAQLVDAELLQQRGLPPQVRYVFRHALLQEAAYESLLPSTRRQYHKQIAQLLVTQFPDICATQPELLAQHYTHAGMRHEAVVYWQQAGQQALERSAYVEAIERLTRGLELLETLPETPERTQQELMIRLTLGTALIATRGYAAPEVGQVYTRARALCQRSAQAPQRFPLLVGLWNFYLVRAELQTAHGLAQQCVHLAQQTNDVALSLEAHSFVEVTLFFLGEFIEAWSHLEYIMARYDPQQQAASACHTVVHLGVACLSYAAWNLWLRGYPEQARRQSAEALALAQALRHPYSMVFALTLAGWLQQWSGEWQRAQELAGAARTLAVEHGFRFWEAYDTALLGTIRGQLAGGEAGITYIRQGLTAYQATGAGLFHPHLLGHLAEAYGKAGHPEAGFTALTTALGMAHQHGERWWEAELYRLQGELLLQSGVSTPPSACHVPHVEEATACFHQAFAIARRQQARALELRAAMSLARLWQQQGKRTEAYQILADVYGWFTEGLDTADLRAAQMQLDALA